MSKLMDNIKRKGAMIAYRDELRDSIDRAESIIDAQWSRDSVALALNAKVNAISALMNIEFQYYNESKGSSDVE